MGTRLKQAQRPKSIEDGQGVLRDYAELINMIQRHLCVEGIDPRRVVVKGCTRPALNWRAERIHDVEQLVDALEQIHIPIIARSPTITALTCLRFQLSILHWPEREALLRAKFDGIIRRLKHTSRRSGIPKRIKAKLKPASSLPSPTSRRV